MMAEPGFWERDGEGQQILKERASILDSITPWKQEQKELEEIEILLQLVEEQQDEAETQDLLEKVKKSEETVAQMEFLRMLGGKNDPNNAIVSINAGAGGTEAQDWWRCSSGCTCDGARKRRYTQIIDILTGEEAG
jgi:peptide chain release factor 2